tara:strand:+ start:1222 stop:1419 length:198 start_codon:yes stop_codon:yes gene_type:complete
MILDIFMIVTLVALVLILVAKYENPDDALIKISRKLMDLSRERERQQDETRKRLFDHEENDNEKM